MEDKKKNRLFRFKVQFVFWLTAAGFAAMLLRFWYVSGTDNIRLPQWKSAYRPTLRGSILDRNGRFLALTVSSSSIFIRPYQLKGVSSLQRIAKVTGLSLPVIRKRIRRGTDRFVWLMRQVSKSAGRRVRKAAIPGVYVTSEPRRVYPLGETASHVLGFSGVDHTGLTGAERGWDKILTPGPAPQNRIRNLILTLDRNIQLLVEKEIRRAKKKYRAGRVTSVVMEAASGEILAMASTPSFDPNRFISYPASRYVNPALTRSYEPGSTFKIFTSTYLLKNRLVSLKERFHCPGKIKIYSHEVACTHRHGTLTLAGILSRSCNVGTVKLSRRIRKKSYYRFIRSLGFGGVPGTGLPGESSGILHPPGEWSGLSRSMISIGYEISVTPLQLVRAAAAIANRGVLMRPSVLKAVADWEGRLLWSSSPTRVRRICSPYIAGLVMKMLRATVLPGGTGTRAAVKGIAVCGKTGTAHIPKKRGRGYDKTRYNASFLGFLPIRKRRLVILVLVQEPEKAHLGGLAAAPVFRKISKGILQYLRVKTDNEK